MIFVDTNVFVEANRSGTPLFTSAEVMLELAHTYLPVGRLQTFDAATALIARAGVEIWTLEEADVALARSLYERYPTLQARNLCHLASCRRRGVKEIKTFDETFAALVGNSSIP